MAHMTQQIKLKLIVKLQLKLVHPKTGSVQYLGQLRLAELQGTQFVPYTKSKMILIFPIKIKIVNDSWRN